MRIPKIRNISSIPGKFRIPSFPTKVVAVTVAIAVGGGGIAYAVATRTAARERMAPPSPRSGMP